MNRFIFLLILFSSKLYSQSETLDFIEISEIKRELKKSLVENFGIDHSTLEFEHKDEDCDD